MNGTDNSPNAEPETIEAKINRRLAELQAERDRVIERIIAEHPVVQQYAAAIGELQNLLK